MGLPLAGSQPAANPQAADQPANDSSHHPEKSCAMKSLRWLALLVVPAVLAALPACGNKSNKIKVAFISNNAFEFWKIAQRGTEAAADELGDVQVEFKMPPNGTVEDQRKFIQDLLAKGVKAIAVSPNNVDSQIDFYREVNEKVPLLMVDSDVDEAKDPSALDIRRCYLGTDNVTAGEAVGDLIKQAVPKGGKFIIYVGKLDVLNARQRREGVCVSLAGGRDQATEGLKKVNDNDYPVRFGEYELMKTETDGGKQAACRAKVDDNLSKDTRNELRCLIGLWAYNPPAMLEAVAGFKEGARLGKIALIGFDENEETLQGILDGNVFATVVQDPYKFGYESVKIMAALAKGDDAVLAKYKPDKNKRIWIPHRVIDKKNVVEFRMELRRLKGS
jgi:ribose transport system substrate-binding protein